MYFGRRVHQVRCLRSHVCLHRLVPAVLTLSCNILLPRHSPVSDLYNNNNDNVIDIKLIVKY